MFPKVDGDTNMWGLNSTHAYTCTFKLFCQNLYIFFPLSHKKPKELSFLFPFLPVTELLESSSSISLSQSKVKCFTNRKALIGLPRWWSGSCRALVLCASNSSASLRVKYCHWLYKVHICRSWSKLWTQLLHWIILKIVGWGNMVQDSISGEVEMVFLLPKIKQKGVPFDLGEGIWPLRLSKHHNFTSRVLAKVSIFLISNLKSYRKTDPKDSKASGSLEDY